MSPTLSPYDYAILGTTLVLSTLVGIYFGCFGNKQSTIKDYLLGGKRMKILPIAISVAVSHFSGSSVVATPPEVYRYGSGIWLAFCLSMVAVGLFGIYVYLPVFYKLQLTSVYEYLEKRFDKRTRILGFVFYVLSEILLFPIHAYTPALVFATASGVNVTAAAFTLCIVCAVYTSLGGLKSVVWTDLFQFMIIMTSLITLCAIGVSSAGGFLSIWETALHGERLKLFNFNFDLTSRDNFWVLTLGWTSGVLSSTMVHQTGTQKFLTLPKYSDCMWSMVYFVISVCLSQTFSVAIGLICYAKYKDCDPLSAGMIRKHDQMVPFYVTGMAELVPGLSGLLIAGVCSAALSSMSSDLNALTAVIYREFGSLFSKKEVSDKTSSTVLKIMTLIIGTICAGVVFAMDKLGDIYAITFTLHAWTKGPLLGLFTLGVIFPHVNETGAFYGTILAAILLLSLVIPSQMYHLQGFIKTSTKPLSTAGCGILNHTSNWSNGSFVTITQNVTERPLNLATNTWQPNPIFTLSFSIYPFVGFFLAVIIGALINFIIKSDSEVDPNLLSPVSLPRKSKTDNRGSYSNIKEVLDKL